MVVSEVAIMMLCRTKFDVLQAFVQHRVVFAFIVLHAAESAQAARSPNEQELGVDKSKGGVEGGRRVTRRGGVRRRSGIMVLSNVRAQEAEEAATPSR